MVPVDCKCVVKMCVTLDEKKKKEKKREKKWYDFEGCF